jgi:DDE superfamily endonuclease
VGGRAGGVAEHGDNVTRPGSTQLAAQKKSLIATERNEVARAAWWQETARLDPARLVFVDESGTHTSLTRRRARAPRGERAVGRVPRNHGPNVTLFAALTPRGIGPAMVVTGGADRPACETYVHQGLGPSLRSGQVVVMDRLNVHRGATIQALIEAAGCRLLLLPAYSPDFNPIAQAFAKIKAQVRAAEARTCAALVVAIGTAIDTVTPADAHGCFAHCGFTLSNHLL